LDGYWQDEEYFADCSGQLRTDLTFLEDADAGDNEVSTRIRASNAVCVHIRRYDDLEAVSGSMAGSAVRLPEGYYRKAIDIVRSHVPEARFFIFCDNAAWARSTFTESETLQIAAAETSSGPHRDLRLMSLCKHHILSNSSYSWWSRWLSRSEDGLVVAPAQERWNLMAGMPRLPARWKTLLLSPL
jgi:hypothetical protein